MNEDKNTHAHGGNPVTRRRAIAGIAIALGSLAAAPRALADPQEAAKETPGASAGQPRTSLHYEADFKVGPERVYGLLLDPKQFADMTGRPAVIDPIEGGAFSLFGGLIVGRNVELVPGKRIVQAWRPTHWDPGIYSIVEFEFSEQVPGTRMVLDHKGFPVEEADRLDSGWKGHYLDPLAKFLA
jgi:activator of HSP90 ATPase